MFQKKELDKVFLKNFYKELVDEVGEIFELFIQETPIDIRKINISFEEKEYIVAAKTLHKIAPCFYNVGLPNFTGWAKEIEKDIHALAFEIARQKMIKFELELEEYMPAIFEENERLKKRG